MANLEEKKQSILARVRRTKHKDPSSTSLAGQKRQIMARVKRSRG